MDVEQLAYFVTGSIYCTHNRYAYCTLRSCISPEEVDRLRRDNWAFSIVKIWIILRTYSRRIRKWETLKTRQVKHHLGYKFSLSYRTLLQSWQTSKRRFLDGLTQILPENGEPIWMVTVLPSSESVSRNSMI